jgi:hypothetical protein
MTSLDDPNATVDFAILSGDFVEPGIVAEFGRLPPAFLPLGLRRLFTWQVKFASALGGRIFLSLPEVFEVGSFDAELLDAAGVRVIRVPVGLSLRDSVAAVLAEAKPSGPLRVLYGDTLIVADPLRDFDIFAIGHTDQYYAWADFEPAANGSVIFRDGLPRGRSERPVVSGYFAFEDGPLLARALASATTFIDALNHYAHVRVMRPIFFRGWMDFGHLQTYYQSRTRALSSRDFNTVVADRKTVRKSSEMGRKIRAESIWFASAPPALRPFLPQLIDVDSSGERPSYEIEYLYLPPLNELFVFGDLPAYVWDKIFDSCFDYINICNDYSPPADVDVPALAGSFFRDIVQQKTLERIEDFAAARGIDLREEWCFQGRRLPSLARMVDQLIEMVPPTEPHHIGLWHGDFCFSNILYDFRAQRVRVIDPRGMLSDGTVTAFGDLRYDLAKLSHSVLGLYDHIVAGYYRLTRPNPYEFTLEFPLTDSMIRVQEEFVGFWFARHRPSNLEIKALTALLFFSMLPLHKDSPQRQDALLANGMRLFYNIY